MSSYDESYGAAPYRDDPYRRDSRDGADDDGRGPRHATQPARPASYADSSG